MRSETLGIDAPHPVERMATSEALQTSYASLKISSTGPYVRIFKIPG